MTLKDLLKAYVQPPSDKDPEEVLRIGDPTPVFVFIVDEADKIQAVRRSSFIQYTLLPSIRVIQYTKQKKTLRSTDNIK